MNREEIIRMAQEAGFCHDTNNGIYLSAPMHIEAFAALVASAERERIKQANAPEIERINTHIKELEDAVIDEREACAKVCESIGQHNIINQCATAIRARGQA